MIRVKVRFFATLRDRTGVSECEMDLPSGANVSYLKKKLIERFPKIEEAMPTALVALNKKYAFDEDTLPDGAEVALFPPVSGGGEFPTIIRITPENIDFETIVRGITLPTTGAVGIFCGIVREVTARDEPHITNHLVYEAYEAMAEEKMRQIVHEIRTRWPHVEGIAIVQRVGSLSPGTPTVLIACSAPHRHSGIFEAARYGIDRLKEIVPIWKKEVSSEGEYWVEGEYFPKADD